MEKKTRESNFELMRIISMFMIVLWHVIIHGRLLGSSTGLTNLIYNLLLCVFIVHVNSFILASGYFQSNNNFSLKKFLKLFGLQWFYRAVITIILYSFNIVTMSYVELINEVLPIGSANYWFINCYLVLYLLSPFLNKLISALNQIEYRRLLLVSFLLFSIISYVTNNSMVSNNGYTIIQFCFLYLIGAYFKRFPVRKNYHFKNFSREKSQLIFLSVFVFCFFLNFTLYLASIQLSTYTNKYIQQIASYIASSQYNYSTPIAIIQSISYFLYFETLNLKNNFINKVASIILGIYLIHDNMYIRTFLYKLIRIDTGKQQAFSSLFWMLIAGIGIFLSCLLIELLRSKLTKMISNFKTIKKMKDRFYGYIDRI